MKVKICGITNSEDARFCESVGADFIGMILYPKSPRFVDKEKRGEILGSVTKAKKVAVMVNPSLEEAEQALEEGFDLIQLHGEESLEFASHLGIDRVIKAFRVGSDIPRISEGWKGAYAILLDTYTKGAYGGTGKTFNWDIARHVVDLGFRVFLSGGLKPENVAEAVGKVKPFGVDVSSGVELKPGVKDRAKITKFIEEAKAS